MRRRVTLAEAAHAAEELASALLGYNVAKAIDPLTDSGFVMIAEMAARKLASAASGAEALVVADLIKELDFDWAELSIEATDAAIEAIKQGIAKSYATRVLPRVSGILTVEGPSVMKETRLSVIAHERIKIVPSLSQRDIAAEEVIRASHLNFIRDSSGRRIEALSKRAREVVASKVEQGLSTKQIGADLQALFSAGVPRPESYWRVVADAFVGRARATSQIGAYEDGGIERYEVVAVMDEVTSDICRFMDGRVFEVSAARGLLNTLNGLEDPEEVKYANPWVRKGADPEGGMRLYVTNADGTATTIARIERSGVGSLDDRGEYSHARSDAELASLGIPIPPFHGRCRTTIVAAAE